MPIAAVQRQSKGFSGVSSCAIGSGDGWATPTSGNLIVLTVNGDQTFSTPSGYTAGPSVVDDNAVYLFWKISAGNETTPTITPGGTTTAVMTACEYSGVAASPADGSNTSSIVNVVGTTTTSTSVTTTAAGDLVIAVAALAHYTQSVSAPSSPNWTNSFTNQVTVDVGAATNNHANTFYAELLAGSAGSYSTSCSWTTGMLERQELLAAFQAAATADPGPSPVLASGPARISPSGRWTQFPFSSQLSGQTFTQSLAGSVTPTGALTRQTNKALAGSITGTGSLAKQVNKAIAGSVTATGTLTKQVAKALAGSVTPSGALAKSVAKTLAGSVTPTGTLTTIKVVLRSFTGSVTSTGVLTRQANKALAGSSTPRGAVTKAVAKALSGTVTAVGTLAKLVAKPFAGRSTPTGAVTPTPVGATQNATSTTTVAAGRTSSPSVSAGRSSTAQVSAKATSTPSVSDG